MTSRIAVTFDTDWAPEWAIEVCLNACQSFGVPATFFTTHDSPILKSLEDRSIEVGIHMNFLPGSSHGKSFDEVLETCLAFAPGAQAMRTHDLFQATSLFTLIVEKYPQLRTDASLVLPFHEGLQGTELFLGNGKLTRLPCFWEDDLAASVPGWNWNRDPGVSHGLEVYSFHPIHVALNMVTLDTYRALKKSLGSTPLTECTKEQSEPFRAPGEGTYSFLEKVLARAARLGASTVSALADSNSRSRLFS